MRTIRDVEIKYAGKLDKLDLDLIVAHVIKKSREFVLAHPEHKIPKFKIENLKFKIARRRRGEPLAYILGHKEFFGLAFKVTKDTLIPRPETELLVELALQETRNKKRKTTIIDVGTGSGNIIISLAKNLKEKNNYIAIDISKDALKIARQNAKLNSVVDKIKFVHRSLLEKIKDMNDSIIIANLPYLDADWKNLLKSSESAGLKYEPSTALYGGDADGLGLYRLMAKQIKSMQPKNVVIFCEIGHLQMSGMKKIFSFAKKIEFKKDLAGKWRICKIKS